METYIPARSPLFAYAPCRDCEMRGVGWVETNSTDARGLSGGVGRLSIGLNFTGTGIDYRFVQPPPPDWTIRLLVNSSAPPSSSNLTRTSLTNLALGPHRFTLDLFPPSADPFSPSPPNSSTTSNVTFLGATGYMGTMLTASTKNTTIDDSAWRNEDVLLSPGWNMLEGAPGGVSNWINTPEMDIERTRARENYNSSLSWTEQRGANTTIRFQGEAVWVYGGAGGEAGSFEVVLDNRTMGVFNASGGAREYGQILYHTALLPKGNHTLTLRNREEGKRLSFDRLVAMSGLVIATPRPTASDPTTTLYPTTDSSSSSKSLPIGALAGIAVAAIFVVLCIIAGVLFGLWKRDPKRRMLAAAKAERQGEKKGDTDNTFCKFPRPRTMTPPFFRLADPTQPGAVGAIARIFKRKSREDASKTSFVPELNSPRSSNRNLPASPSSDRYTSFLNFSKSPRRGDRERPPISSPIPFADSSHSPNMEKRDSLDGLSPALAAAISGRTTSPLAQLHRGEIVSGEEKSYLPKMSAIGAMFSSLSKDPKVPGEKRFSIDTIGKIFGQYAGSRDTMSGLGGGEVPVGVAVGSREDRERWDERVKQVGRPMAI